MRNFIYIFFIIVLTVFSGCGISKIKEPEGIPVTLTKEDINKVRWARDTVEMWCAWHTKGNRLANNGKYYEALFCYNMAMKAWPKEDKESKIKHHPVPTDTIFSKGILFLNIQKPELAIQYFKEFNSYFPPSVIQEKAMEKAKAMLRKQKS